MDIIDKNRKFPNKEINDDFYFTIILDLASYMQDLNLDLNFTKKLLVNSIGKIYIKNVCIKFNIHIHILNT